MFKFFKRNKKEEKPPIVYMAVKDKDCQGMYFTKIESARNYLGNESGWIEELKIDIN